MRTFLKRLVGTSALESTQSFRRELELSALLAKIKRLGWTLDSLSMSDRQARAHFANDTDPDVFNRVAIRLFHECKIQFIVQALGWEYLAARSIIEIGDSDGLLLKALGKKGTSVNNDVRCTRLASRNGIQSVIGVGEKIDAPDQSYDIAMSFETLEHSLSPFVFLQEMARVAAEKVVISVPGVTRSYLHPRVKGARVGEEHVFELCERDLLSLTTHLPLTLSSCSKCPMFALPSTPIAALYYLFTREPDLYGGCFRWFDFYVFDVVHGDHGRSRAESVAVYQS